MTQEEFAGGLRILLVEDDPSQAERVAVTVSQIPVSQQVHLEHVPSVAEALSKGRGQSFDAVLLDLHVADSRGMETFTAIHRNLHDVPIVILCSLEDKRAAQAALSKGAQDYIFKEELGAVSLIVTLHSAMQRHRFVRDLRDGAGQRDPRVLTHDRITGLPNHASFQVSLGEAVALAKRHRDSFAVMFASVEAEAGGEGPMADAGIRQLLKEIGSRLRGAVRASDTVARLSADEFAIILRDSQGSVGAVRVANKVINELGRALHIGGRAVTLRGSIGISLFPDDADNGDGLLTKAESAMQAARSRGGEDRWKLASGTSGPDGETASV